MTTVISPSAASPSTLTTASMQPTSPGMFLKAYNIPTCYILRRKKWSSQWRQFMQLRKEPWKKIQDLKGVWTRDLAIPVQCSNNWAMKPLTLGAGQLWVHMFPWKKWVLMIYEINHIFNSNWPTPNVRLWEKNVHATIPNGNMGYEQYTVPDTVAVKPTFMAFL